MVIFIFVLFFEQKPFRPKLFPHGTKVLGGAAVVTSGSVCIERVLNQPLLY
jgi:hypothetical protein